MEDSFQVPLSPSPSETPLDDFIIDDLLNIPNDDTAPAPATPVIDGSSSTDSSSSSDVRDFQNNGGGIVAAAAVVAGATGGSSSSTTNESSAAVGAGNRQFAAEFGVPLEDLAELEWLSNFVEDSFSSTDEGLHKLQLAQEFQARPDDLPYFQPDDSRPSPSSSPIPAKARSKRSRPAPGNWTSRLLVVSTPVTPTATSSSDSFDTITASMAKKPLAKRSKKEGGGSGGAGRGGGGGGGADGEGRRCLHCATDKTPQWRTGPMGPKTLCNACGVRYKSGRLVPEYRPAASPTFVLAKHSNSHRKVLELRRQKEMMRAQHQHQHQPFMNHHHHHQQASMIFDASSNGEDYLIHQHVGPDFRHLI